MTRRNDTGLIRPYRPRPHDFRQYFVSLGGGVELEEVFRTNWRVIRRWRLEENERAGIEGRPSLEVERRRYLKGIYARSTGNPDAKVPGRPPKTAVNSTPAEV